MARVAILGAGRIAEVHARGVVLAGAELAGVFDIREDASQKLASRFSTRVFRSIEEALNDRTIDVVAIATSTDTHADYIVAAAKAGKAIFCEKPIDLSVARVEDCRKQIEGIGAFIQIGFNRRFDPTFLKVAATVHEGRIGRLENLTIISRDPAPASIEYYKVSGGIFKDMTIHDFDMARFIMPEEPVEVFAAGSVLVREEIGAIGDIDTATVVLKTASGIHCQIVNSRHCPFGFDQRIEAFGPLGAVHADNPRIDEVRFFARDYTDSRSRLPDFFLERYTESYNREWLSFFERLASAREPEVGFDDGLQALRIAEAANESLSSGAIVRIG
jgi:myo-inositol 2-dehydrogenase/D-chiro-inositol 1-dehydrogenase